MKATNSLNTALLALTLTAGMAATVLGDKINPEDFGTTIDNPFFPLAPNTTYVYVGTTEGSVAPDEIRGHAPNESDPEQNSENAWSNRRKENCAANLPATCQVQSATGLRAVAGNRDDHGSGPKLDQSSNERWKLPRPPE